MLEHIEHYDVIIIGGGPAGMSAALWCSDLGIKAVVLEKGPELGGQLLWTFSAITNYLGVEAANGRALRDRFLEQVERTRVACVTNASITRADLAARTVTLEDGRSFTGHSIIIATGVRRRKLGVPGENEFAGRGILGSGVRDRAQVAGKRVVIVGGGDAALENALTLSQTAMHVTIAHRRKEFSARREFLDSARADPKIEFARDTQVIAIEGDQELEGVGIRSAITGEVSLLAAEAVLIRIGVTPNTEFFAGRIELDDDGYVVVDKRGQTSRAGVFAVGDAAEPVAKTIAVATGSAAGAVKHVFEELTGPSPKI